MKKIARILVIVIALLIPSVLSAQQKVSIKGKVIDETGQPVPGAVVMLEGSTTAASMTDEKGQYSLEFNMPASGKPQITVNCIGYAPQTVDVSGRSVIDFNLSEDAEQLDESVVVGYGSMRRSDLTGAFIKERLVWIDVRPAA